MIFFTRNLLPKRFKNALRLFLSESMILVTEQDIINTYSDFDQHSCKKYFEYQELLKQNPSFGYKKCAKILGIPAGRIRWWHTKGSKRGKPIPLKTIDKLKENGFLSFDSENEHIESILRILGTLFGDGGIDCRMNTMSFISAHKEDVELWKNDLIKIFPFVEQKMNLREGGEYGHSYCIRTYDRIVIRFFAALGAPVGDKVSQSLSLPKNIFELGKDQRIAFLDGIFSSEISVPSFRGNNRWVRVKRFTNFQFGMSKIDSLEEYHKQFLRDLISLSNSVGVTFTPNIQKDNTRITLKKNGSLSYCYRIFLQTHFSKVSYFNETFPLKYSGDKKLRLVEQINQAITYRKWKESYEKRNIF